ncbi:MAG: polyprenyl synthetase family protein [Nitrospinaceae bacterium]|nr:polyprenyl synthetase family protein [Nitrospinaceae bacterium]NIR57267.1 polyprenyl synthetase family protein [Nitrospinaceae bacterium]NIS87715.1 polyprenyl synthetase family protein [Nitrospinaceae bacterium]NIT84581.1 polyprenyl synthetase family protein [Nitrospinaceae bacterium]NIU46767.1 polyprenyl synthetase family protein [Nitrospinaceae bacterium]
MLGKEYLEDCKEFIDQAIPQFLPEKEDYPKSIHESMHYSLFAGGKRLRPSLLIASAEAVGGDRNHILPFAVAAEFLHTYTLIHDDLPALDNDSLRRGKPTNHKVFGEAIAILAGDALLTQAFVLMTNPYLMEAIPHKDILRASHEVAKALSSTGVIGGQVVDLESEGKAIDASTLEYIHIYKTGFFFKTCVRVGGLLSNASHSQLAALSQYGAHIGLAFQIIDDILDIVGDKQELGKDIGSDIDKEKATYPALYGLEESRKKAETLVDQALNCLEPFDERANPLREIARFFVQRTF